MNVAKTCPKCGGIGCFPKYESKSIYGRKVVELLRFLCETCSYSWTEPTLDSKQLIPMSGSQGEL